MGHATHENLYNVFGLVIWGDLGPITIYRDPRGRIVFFEKTWPDKPASPDQIAQRAKFTAAGIAWRALTQAQREQWALAANRASLCAHGYDVFTHWQIVQDQKAIETLERQTRTTLLP